MSVRAFELVPAIEGIQFLGEKAQMTIECLECCGKSLYLGSNNSFIFQYLLEEKVQPNGKMSFNCTKESHKYLGMKKAINTIKAASALNRLLVICDATLILLNMFDLEPIANVPKMKGVTGFCVNENPKTNNPFSIQVCIAKRKQIAIFNITEDKAIQLKDISLAETPIAIAMDGVFVCAALSSQYVVVNCETNFIQDLFLYESDMIAPVVRRISKEEFILNGPALGVFVTTAGDSQRPPIQWTESVCSAAYCHPYVLAIDTQFISVYSLLDQQLKQTFQFQGGHIIGNYDGRIYAASQTSVYVLVPVKWEKQVQALLADERITEALELAKHSNKVGMSKDEFSKVYQRFQQQAGFIHLSKFQFDEAKELFLVSQLDFRELISLFPKLLPSSCVFVRSNPALHKIADIGQMCQGNPEKIASCKKFLISYLEEIRMPRFDYQYSFELNTSLLKLYAETDSPELTSLIVSLDPLNGMPREAAEWLEKYERFSALGLFYHLFNENEKALQVWTKILNGEYKDESFQGLSFLVEFLANLSDHDLVWKYADFVLNCDQVEGVKIFTERPVEEEETDRMKPDLIVEYLHSFSRAIVKYLEFIVNVRKLQKEKFHTHLAVLYLDAVLEELNKETSNSDNLQIARTRLDNLLMSSSLYRVQLILGKIQDTELHLEKAILFGKLEQHDKALRILIHDLNDHQAAEDYCIRNSDQKERKFRHRLFQTLLSVYMDPKLDLQRQEELLVPTVRLLNSEAAEFDSVKVLELIPDQWSVGVVQQFLCRSVRGSFHTSRMRSLENSLAKCENLQIKFSRYDLIREPIMVTEEKRCAVCDCPFTEPNFTHFPNGHLAHVHCSQSMHYNKTTGKWMRKSADDRDR